MKNIGASVYDKLTKISKTGGRPFQELLIYYAMERFLARLAKSSESENFILKGALLLHVVSPELARATRDIDFLGQFKNDIASTADRIRKICSIEIEDGVKFDPDKIHAVKIKEDADYEGVRLTFHAQIASAKVPMQLDIGFGDAVTPAAQKTEYPRILKDTAFSLRMYPQETVVAEKLEAMVKLDLANSRMKDFFDIWFLSQGFEFDGAKLQKAIQATFKRRGTDLPPLPNGLTASFWGNPQKMVQWKAFQKRLNISGPEEFAQVGSALAEFLLPIVQATASGDEFKMQWSESRWTK